MENKYNIFDTLGISKKISDLALKSEAKVKAEFEKIDNIAFLNQAKVLKSFWNNKVSQMHFNKTTGYGYGDIGREVIEKIYAEVFGTEDSLVRVQFVNGTHALSTALFAMLMPGDEMLAISGKPYDTLDEVIGICDNSRSLKSYGVKYSQIDLLEDGSFDIEKITEFLKERQPKLVTIQRSRGYSLRKSLSVYEIKDIIKHIKSLDEKIAIMVDNCYGEFVEADEPTNFGADIVCGSLIKNIGGGLCETGAYIAGKKEYIELCAQRLTTPGIGKECGATLDQNRNILQGLFLAPTVTSNALKAAVFTSSLLEELGYETYPSSKDKRVDIIQAITFNDKDKLVKFIQGIQSSSPVDSHVLPLPWEMPGYTSEVIMAAGTFIDGASIELSADSPIRPPYVAYMQGGLTYESAKIAILIAIENMLQGESK